MNIFYKFINLLVPADLKEEVLGDLHEAYYKLKIQGKLTLKSKLAILARGVLVVLGSYQTLIQESLKDLLETVRLNKWINQKFLQSISVGLEAKNQHYLKTQPIKLSVVTQFFPPDYAPTGQLIEELVKQLEQQGVDIEVFTSQPGYAFDSNTAALAVERAGRIRIQRSRTAQLWPGRIRGKAINGILYTLRAILHLLRNKSRCNILLVTTAPPFLPVVGYLANVFFRIPYVCILYDIYPDIAIALEVVSKDNWLVRYWQRLNRLVWQKAEAIVVLSPAMKQQVVANCPQVADKISVIHSWANPELIVPIAKTENWFAWKHNLVNKFTVLYSGSMGRCHDIATILEAAQQLQDEPIQFVCIGGGAKRDELIQEVNQLGLRNFTFLPYQDKQVLPYSLTACDLSLVSVDASIESLVVPSKLYSALAAGRPIAVVCSQYSYLRKLVAEADCGGTFDNGDSHALAQFIRLLSRDQQLGERMGKAGRRYLRSHFTSKIISQQYLDILQEVSRSQDKGILSPDSLASRGESSKVATKLDATSATLSVAIMPLLISLLLPKAVLSKQSSDENTYSDKSSSDTVGECTTKV